MLREQCLFELLVTRQRSWALNRHHGDCSEWEGGAQLGGESWLSTEECVGILHKKLLRKSL